MSTTGVRGAAPAALSGATAPSRQPDAPYYGMLAALVAAVLCAPVLFTRYPPLVDYPNHLARTWLIAQYPHDAAVQTVYGRLTGLIPNMAIDLIVPPLVGPLGMTGAGRAFLVLLMLTFLAGCHALGRAITGRNSYAALLAAFAVYCSMLLYGFVNHVFSGGLFALAFAAWLAWRRDWTAGRLVVCAALVFAAFVAHLGAYSFLGVVCPLVTITELLRRQRRFRDCVLDALPLLPPLLAFVFFMRQGGSIGQTYWNTPVGKVIALAAPIRTYHVWVDALVVVAWAVLLGVALRASRRTTVRRPVMLCVAGLFAAFLACPMVLFTSWGADTRFVLPLATLLPFTLALDLPPRAARGLTIAALAVSAGRVGAIWAGWQGPNARAAQAASLFPTLPVGARVFPAFYAADDVGTAKQDRGVEHVLFYAMPERRLFVPTLFATRGLMPLHFRNGETAMLTSRPRLLPEQLHGYDYVWAHKLPPAEAAALARIATPVAQAGPFSTWRVNPVLAAMPGRGPATGVLRGPVPVPSSAARP